MNSTAAAALVETFFWDVSTRRMCAEFYVQTVMKL
jgi:hypothetical protein